MLHWIQAHQVIATWIAAAVYTAAVTAMPTPDEKSGPGYKWLYAFLHALTGAFARIPGVRDFFSGNAKQS